MTRDEFAAGLPGKSLKRTLRAIETAIGDQATVEISLDRLSHDFGTCRATASRNLRQLQASGLIDVSHGVMRVTVLARSQRWQTIAADDIAGLLAQARLPRRRKRRSAGQHKSKRPVVKVVEADDDEPEAPQYKTPGLPHIKWLDNWREE